MAKLMQDGMGTIVSAQAVIQKRLPMIAEVWTKPFSADHREIGEMVTEKIEAFGKAGRSANAAHGTVRRAAGANVHAFKRLSGGGFLDLAGWAKILERNLEIMATLAMLPTAVLAPVHAKTTANARRLGKT